MPEDVTDALAAARQRQAAARTFAAAVRPEQVQAAVAINQAYPNLSAEAWTMGMAGTPPTAPVVAKVAEKKTKKKAEKAWYSRLGSTVTGAVAAGAGKVEDVGDYVTPDRLGVGNKASNAAGYVVEPAKDLSRIVTAGMSAPYEVVQAGIRNVVEATNTEGSGLDRLKLLSSSMLNPTDDNFWLTQSTVAGGVSNAMKTGDWNPDTNLGKDSWFVQRDSAGAKEQRRRARQAGMIDGHAITPGRAIAADIVEPGSNAYNVMSGVIDFGATIFLDPTTYVGGGVAKANRGRKVFDQGKAVDTQLDTVKTVVTKPADPGGLRQLPDGRFEATPPTPEELGVVRGVRNTVLPEKVSAWLTSEKGSKVADAFAKEQDFERLRQSMGKKVPLPVLLALKDADDPVQVKNILADAAQGGFLRDKPVYAKRLPQPRMAGMMPGRKIDLQDPEDAVETLDRFQRATGVLSREERSANNEKLARAFQSDQLTGAAAYDVTKAVLEVTRDALVKQGIPVASARKLTAMVDDLHVAGRKYNIDDPGNIVGTPASKMGPDGNPLPTPQLLNEALNRYVSLPDARALREATTRWRRAVDAVEVKDKKVLSVPLKIAEDVADVMTQEVFKTLTLPLRPAWPVRVIAEDNFRMMFAGYDSLFDSPLSYLSIIVGDKPDSAFSRMVGRAARPKMAGDITGKNFVDEAIAARYEDHFSRAMNRGGGPWRPEEMEASTKYWDDFGKDDRKSYLRGWGDELTQLNADPVARELARGKMTLDEVKDFWWKDSNRAKASLSENYEYMATRAGSDEYVEQTLARLKVKTRDHPELLEAVAANRLAGSPMTVETKLSKQALARLEALADDFGPTRAKGRVTVSKDGSAPERVTTLWKNATGPLWHLTGTIPQNKLSRSPVYRQAYWKRIEEIVPLMSKEAREASIVEAKKNRIGKGRIKSLEARLGEPEGKLSVDDADLVARQHGLSATEDLLFSMHDKSQVADALRLMQPFADPMREAIKRWAQLAAENPLVTYRLSQAVTNSRESGFFQTVDNADGTQREVFTYPGSAWLSKVFTGVPAPMQADVNSLNTVTGGVMSGVGPVVALPVSAVLPDDPSTDQMRKWLFPFSEPDTSGGLIESFAPGYIKKLIGWKTNNPKVVANTTMDAMKYLQSTGDYDMGDAEDRARLIADAKESGSRLVLLRALVQSSAPAAPAYQARAQLSDGRLVAISKLQEDYGKMLDEDPQTATLRFMDKYGNDLLFSVLGRTEGESAVTESSHDLARDNPEVVAAYPKVWSLFTDPDSPYSSAEQQRQMDSGERTRVSPEDAVQKTNQRIASARYGQYREQVGDRPSDEQQAWLRQVQQALRDKYPGYSPEPDGIADKDRAVQQLIEASTDPTLSATDAGQGLAVYLRYREQAMQQAQAAGLAGFSTAKSAAPLRAWLRSAGEAAAQKHPGFAPMWQRVLQGEMVRDDG